MPIFIKETLLAATARRVWDFHMAPGALERLTPPDAGVRIVTQVPVANGSVVELSVQLKPLPLRVRWLSRHEQVTPPHLFVDVALQSPFARWEHRHIFESRGNACLMRDEVHFQAPLGVLGNTFAGPFIRHTLASQFSYRHARLVQEFGAG